ncbi:restriction endonuclease [Brachybacterium conglomeratum]|uniref:restriction endonuclease n=1 Tax=Brachybacterium conglomeratum TaxID=47846 RepID=UPI003DA1258E
MERISTEAYGALRDALPVAFWFKREFERYLGVALRAAPELLTGINFNAETKRESAETLVDRLVASEHRYRETTLDLMLDLSGRERFPDIERLEEPDRSRRLADAREAVSHLRKVTSQLAAVRAETERHRTARETEQRFAAAALKFSEDINGLKTRFLELHDSASPQQRGLELEHFLVDLVSIFDVEPRLGYVTALEQIDGSFRLDNQDYIVEAKWQKPPVSRAAVDTFAGKIARKGKNALGLFVAINGLSSTAREAHRESTPFITMDGADLFSVLEQRIRLDDPLRIKQRHANDTGSCYYPSTRIL